jgi:hypothetical protein
VLRLLALLLSALCTFAAPVHGQREGGRVALVIAVGEYGEAPEHPETGAPLRAYGDLNAGNDVPLVTGALKVHGFSEDEIRVLRDEEADADGIRRAFRWLTRQVDEGDVVVLHYSGHGHRITNDNPKEDEETDGYDELLVPYGAPEEFFDGYDGSLHIRDDELGELLQRLRERAGPRGNVTFFIDACFSGTATRGQDAPLVRGVMDPLGEPAGAVATRGGSRGERGTGLEGGEIGGPEAREGLAPFAVFSAASQRQVAYETFDVDGETRVGSLSFALARVLPAAEPGVTYRALSARVANALAGRVRQTPQAEGTLDAQLFSSRLSPQRPYVVVDSVAEAEGVVTLGAGSLLGLNPGTRLEVYPTGTGGPGVSEPLASLEVVQASPQQARARLLAADAGGPDDNPVAAPDRGADPNGLLGQWAFVTARSFGELRTRVRLHPDLPPRDMRGATARLGEMGIVELVDSGAEVEVYREDDQLVARALPDGPVLARGAMRVIRQVESYARAQYLRRLSFQAERLQVELELAPTEVERNLFGEITGCAEPRWGRAAEHPGFLGAGQWALREGDVYHLRVRNTGERRAFIALLDILPRGDVNVLRPREDESPGSYELEAGQELHLGCYQLADPEGVETLKLFATLEPQDFRSTFQSRNAGTRGPGEDLSQLQAAIGQSFGTRASVAPSPRGVATTRAIHIQLSPGG